MNEMLPAAGSLTHSELHVLFDKSDDHQMLPVCQDQLLSGISSNIYSMEHFYF